jgi:DNA (cytosine-5)-methyltransferase 1
MLPKAPRTRVFQGQRAPIGRAHRVAGLFAGIGGLELGLARAGHKTRILCENDPAAMAVLRTRFPGVRLHDDVRTLRALPRGITLIAAGFPCQDLSQAGGAEGIGGERSGLIEHVFELVRRYRTPWVLLENVPFMLQLSAGEAMDVIATRFEGLGYCWAYRIVDSRAFGLPQRRRRVYFVATRAGDPRSILFADDEGDVLEPLPSARVARGVYWTEGNRGVGWAVDAIPTLKGGSGLGIPSPPAILCSDGRIVTPHIRDAERLQGFRSDWTKPAERMAKRGMRWKLVGNAVSVPVAQWLGRRLAKPGHPREFKTVEFARCGAWPSAAWNIGRGRVEVKASAWPLRRSIRSLEDFLIHPQNPLSAKATSGFLRRAIQAQRESRLRFDNEFLNALSAHLKSVADPCVRTEIGGDDTYIAPAA